MDYNEKNVPQEDGIDMQTVMHYAKKVLEKWWIVLLCAVICATSGFAFAKITYEPMYTCKMQFVVDNKREDTVTGGQSSSDLSAGISLAQSYQVIMTETRSLLDDVAANSGYKISGNDVKNMLSSKLVEETNIISLYVTSSDPEVSYAVAASYLNNYSKVTEVAYSNTRAIVIDPPVKPVLPDSDNSAVTYPILGFLLGAMIVVAVICIKVMLKGAVKSTEDIQSKLDSRLLGTVTHVENKDKKKNIKKSLLITDKKTDFMFSESYKLMRTKIENLSKRNDYKVFLVTSAGENEGKTTASVNLALSLAKNGKSVLLIDADLRKPSVHKALGIGATNETGLVGIINGEKTINDSIKYFEKYNLFLLVEGQGVPDSSELLSTTEMADIISSVREEFDYIIIDTPPAGLVADASIVAQYADAGIMVVRNDYSPIRRIKKAIDDLESIGADIIGCVYNDADSKDTVKFIKSNRKNRKNSAPYGYGYGYGYEEKNRK